MKYIISVHLPPPHFSYQWIIDLPFRLIPGDLLDGDYLYHCNPHPDCKGSEACYEFYMDQCFEVKRMRISEYDNKREIAFDVEPAGECWPD